LKKEYLNVVPPSSNRGAQNTSESGLKACVDWLSSTFEIDITLTNVFELLGLDQGEFTELDHGKYGYKKQLIRGPIKVLYDGSDQMGIHVEMTGEGVRQYQMEKNIYLFMAKVMATGKITRLDLSIDDYDGLLNLSTIERKIRRGEVQSKFKNSTSIRKYDLKDGRTSGRTIYFGSSSSRIRFRIYDKKEEQERDDLEHWTRLELQAREERAQLLTRIMLENEVFLGDMIRSVVGRYIRFTVKGQGKNKSRWETAPFWTKFLNGVSQVKLTQEKPEQNIEKTEKWIYNQVSVSLSLLFKWYEGDIEKLMDIISHGKARTTNYHEQKLNYMG